MIENACPYALEMIKSESMSRPQVLISALMFSFSYLSLNWGGSPVLFQDLYIVKMSIYTYVSEMIAYYFHEYRRKKE